MKRALVAFALLLGAVAFVRAQDRSALSTATRLAYDYLNQKEYLNAIDEENDVQFVVNNRAFYLLNTEKDPTLIRISMPSVYSVDLNDDAQLLATLMAPATNLVRVFVAPLTGVLYVLKAKSEKDGGNAGGAA